MVDERTEQRPGGSDEPEIPADPVGAVGFRAERGTSAHIATLVIGGRNVAPVPPGAS